MRKEVLARLLKSGGRSSAVAMCGALDIKHRQSLAAHAKLLARANLVRVTQTGSGRSRSTLLMITDRGRIAVAGNRNPLTPQSPP